MLQAALARHARRSRDEHVRNTDDTGGQERYGVASETEGLEDGWRVVQNGVDTSSLLEEHCHGPDGGTVDKGCASVERAGHVKSDEK